MNPRKRLAVVLTIAMGLSMIAFKAPQLSRAASCPLTAPIALQGTVYDALNSPVNGVYVSDGGHYTYSASDGTYAICETNAGATVTLTARKQNYVTATQNGLVGSPNPYNFNLQFVTYLTLNPFAVNSTTAQTITVTAKSGAPEASQVSATMSDSGQQVSLSPAGQDPNGLSTWTAQYTVAAGRAEGSYAATASLTNGPNPVSPGASSTYYVDNTPPSIPLSQVMPLGHGNTMYTSQPLSATITDNLSGVNPNSISFTLRDLTAATNTTLTAASYANNVALTAPVNLIAGHIYSMAVSAADYAGNVGSADQGTNNGQGFLAITAAVDNTTAALEPNTGTIDTSHLNGNGTYNATFANVLLDIAPTQVHLSGTQHAGFGYIQVAAPLNSAQVCTTVGGQQLCQSAYNSSDPTWTARLAALQFGTNTNNSGASLSVYNIGLPGINLGNLQAQVPAYWTNATLQMTSVAVTPAIPTCGSPADAAAFPNCGPDPLRFFIPDNIAQNGQTTLNTINTNLGASAAGQSASNRTILYYIDKLILGKYRPVAASPIGPRVGFPNLPSPFVPVAYPSGYPALASFQYPDYCQATWACTSLDASINYPDYYCNPPNNNSGCTMYVQVQNLTYQEPACCNPNGPPYYHQYFGMSGYAIGCTGGTPPASCSGLQWGFPDSDGTNDGATIAWGGPWAYNYYATSTYYNKPDGSCPVNTTWTKYQGGGTYQSGGDVDTVAVPNWQAQNYLGWENPNEVWYGCGGGPASQLGLAGWGVAADMVEGKYHGEIADLNGQYEHVTSNTSWSWSYGLGWSGPTITTTPSTSTNMQPHAADPAQYGY